DIKLQMVSVEVIALENGRWMGAKRLVDDGFNAVSRNDCLVRIPLDVLGGYKLFGDHDESLTGFRLFLIFPACAMNLRISLAVANLQINKTNIGIDRPQENVLFACERTLHALQIVGRRSCLEPL